MNTGAGSKRVLSVFKDTAKVLRGVVDQLRGAVARRVTGCGVLSVFEDTLSGCGGAGA